MSAGQLLVPVTAVYQTSDTRTRSKTIGFDPGRTIEEAIQFAKTKASSEESLTSLLIRFTAEEG